MKNKIKSQHIFYQTLTNAFIKNKIPHAFLITGNKADYRKDIALYIAQSLICKEDKLACGQCEDCLKIIDRQYFDLILMDGTENSIKKADIESMQLQFKKVALESKGIKIYIIHQVDNATIEASNTLLKFLEEPTDQTYAILTCGNIEKVLPTIVSRAQSINLKEVDIDEKVVQLVTKGLIKEDAYILSNIYDDDERIINESEQESFQDIKQLSKTFLKNLFILDEQNYLLLQTQLLKKYNDKRNLQLFFKIIYLILKDAFREEQHQAIKVSDELYLKIMKSDSKSVKLMQLILEIQNKLMFSNMNTQLLIDHFYNQLTKEDE